MTKKKDLKKKSALSNNEEVRKLTEITKNMPNVRQEKIDKIKKQIESGTYDVSAESIAKSIITYHKELTIEKSPKEK